jgi:tetratricopeptide (TPR) repeat protein
LRDNIWPWPAFSLKISPHALLAIAKVIEKDEKLDGAQVAAWEKAQGRHPLVQVALGKRALRLGRPDDAGRYFRAAQAAWPDKTTYLAVADGYNGRGLIDKWRQTLDEYLQQDDPDMYHAQVRVEIARYLMGRRNWDEAVSYAKVAARTGTEWAMRCAAECYEGAGDFAQAEPWFRAVSERYEAAWLDWLLFCKRTGRGDVKEAEQLAARRIDRLGPNASVRDVQMMGFFYTLAGRPQQALEAFRRANRSTTGASEASMLLVAWPPMPPASGRNATRPGGSWPAGGPNLACWPNRSWPACRAGRRLPRAPRNWKSYSKRSRPTWRPTATGTSAASWTSAATRRKR